MPILSKDLFEGRYDPLDPFVSVLPDEHIMTGAEVSDIYAGIVKELPAAQLVNAANGVRSVSAGVATTLGIADYTLKNTSQNPLGELAKIADLDLTFVPSVFTTDAAKLVRDAVGMVVEQVVDRVLTKMPVLGIVAKVAVMFYRAVNQLRRDVEGSPKSFVAPIAYHRQSDAKITNRLLAKVRGGGELTNIFLPTRYEPGFYPKDTKTAHGVPGVVLKMTGPEQDGEALVPGIADIAENVQYPNEGTGRATSTTFGELHPSAAQMSLVLWQAILRNGPLAFQINGDKIADGWEDYYDRLIDYGNKLSGGSAEWQWRRIMEVASWAQYGAPKSSFDKYFPERQSHGGLPATPDCKSKFCVPKRYCHWRGRSAKMLRASRGGLVRYFIEQQWEAKLKYYLGTITCAYVPKGAPALAGAGLIGYHEGMRRLLLTHRARYKVDMDMVPDDGTGYRADLARSIMAAPTKGLAMAPAVETPEPKFKSIMARIVDHVPGVDPELEGLSPDLAPDDPAIPGPDVDSGALLGLLIAAGTGALLYGTLKGVKR